MDDKTDEALVGQIQSGDVLAFEILVKRYQKRLFSFVYRVVRDQFASEEVIQDTFYNIYKTIDRIETNRKFSTYLFSAARNQAISYLRSIHKTIPITEQEIDDDESIYEKLIAIEKKQTVNQALSKIESKYRRVLKFYYFDDLSYEQISSKLKLPLNTIRTHLKRAKDALKKFITL